LVAQGFDRYRHFCCGSVVGFYDVGWSSHPPVVSSMTVPATVQ
jgi:hypothetical protein